ncbi:TIR domain-containing protein [Paenibacillus sp. LjRoot56]|uniref:TIR domain-containing protein n=1 Tax=Paenibacillus sp. LjRoot56 TaxID=3342333 RepID=UPI003ECE7CE6
MNSKTHNLFISHSWAYGDAYEKLVGMLNNSDLKYKNYSVPKNDPIHNAANDKQLHEAIKNQIRSCNVVLIMCGVYASYSTWINKEIYICKQEFSKPLIAIEPWGAERTSAEVKKHADIVVSWRTDSIVSAIKKLG